MQRGPGIPSVSLQIEKSVCAWLGTWVPQSVLSSTWSPQTLVGKPAWHPGGQAMAGASGG